MSDSRGKTNTEEAVSYDRNQRVESAARLIGEVSDELTAALCDGALWNPESFHSMLRAGSDNRFHAWRNTLEHARRLLKP